ncbi:magnesium protoporphyrin IX methyltransferase [Stappia sp. ES.058]|uniref:magnesium protoporphyrin IX methyltransferase n=1 Tax=Stappia sp. ES.058 TaxID=1881061 RepID=UPI000B8A5577|nr:magnesium protoporphyrin IX methyltransferase [Stappia sp. ES.058]
MSDASYVRRRGELQVYFDRTAVDAWKKFASDEPLGRIRATVRAGRDRMRATLLSGLPDDLAGWRVLDAGCGAGHLSLELARRGAEVVGIDLSPEMVRFAQGQAQAAGLSDRVRFEAGDMLSDAHGRFDAVVAMDSLIHYRSEDIVTAVSRLADHTDNKILFTLAPRTPLLAAMHTVGRLFPRGDRAPSIEPASPTRMTRLLGSDARLDGWRAAQGTRVSSGFYISQAMEVARS